MAALTMEARGDVGHAGLASSRSSRLLHRELVADQTLAIRIARPPGFSFRAGQYVDLTALNSRDRDAVGPTRSLSIASAPGADHLEFVMRVRDTAFKRTLMSAPPGTSLLVDGPFDDLRINPADRRHLVFVAGGVGIAPFLSVVRQAAAEERPLDATLLYSNRRPEDAAYLDELTELQGAISGFRVVATMTGMATSTRAWDGETARLQLEFFERHLPSLPGPAYYLVGLPLFISQLRLALRGAGVADADIGLEMYSGY